MMSRRVLLQGLAATAAAALREVRGSAEAAESLTPVRFDVPTGAADCHIHVIGEPAKFPFAAERVYTPPLASADMSIGMHRLLHVTRTVVVQPSVYGTDNTCMLDALAQLGASSRGIAVIDDKATDAALDAMDRAGVRGIRINLETPGQTDPNVGRHRLQASIARLKGRPWHIQIYTRPAVVQRIADLVDASSVPIVFDHFGGAQASLGVEQPGFGDLVRLVKAGKAYVKISGAYRASTQGPDYRDVAPLAKALISANLDRILWGTDWPHVDSTPRSGRKPTDVAPPLSIDDGRLFNQLGVWAPSAAQRRRILVANPARLYRF
jgi:predicted TIM-barrel fold metal-dependent hydrolase